MIIYEVMIYHCGNTTFLSMYFSNKRKASAFVAQNKKEYSSLEIIQHLVPNNKTDIIKFLNRDEK